MIFFGSSFHQIIHWTLKDLAANVLFFVKGTSNLKITTKHLVYFCFRYGHLNPINFLEGIHRDRNRGWVKASRLETEHDYLNYIKRLEALPKQVRHVSFWVRVSHCHLHVYFKYENLCFHSSVQYLHNLTYVDSFQDPRDCDGICRSWLREKSHTFAVCCGWFSWLNVES